VSKAIKTLRDRIDVLRAEVDFYRGQPNGRNADAYGPLLNELLQTQDALMRLQDPELAALLDRRN
jgi:hypothetical protein